jgi:hypothetical protein
MKLRHRRHRIHHLNLVNPKPVLQYASHYQGTGPLQPVWRVLYGLNDPGFGSQHVTEFSVVKTCGPTLGPTQPIQWVSAGILFKG